MSYKRLDPEDFLVSVDSITSTVWSGNTPTLTTFFTSSTTSSNDEYYKNVYQDSSRTDVEFAISYGDKLGSGSTNFNDLVPYITPTRTVYGQFRNLIYGDENTEFNFGGTDSETFWALTVDRARYKEKLLPGTFNLSISGSGGDEIIYLTDNSGMVTTDTYLDCGRVYQIISGSNGTSYDGGTGYSTSSGSYGLFLPDISTIILNPLAISSSINVTPNRTLNSNGDNLSLIFEAISGSIGGLGTGFKLNSEETLTSDYVFVRARNSELNYSENPSFISGSTGDVLYDSFINSPQSYVTTVGLYNDTNELLAVAKLSKPLVKDFTKETLLRVKIDF
jgi:hypothetical protein